MDEIQMKYINYILIIVLITSSCRASKKVTRTYSDTTTVSQHHEINKTVEVKNFDDTLRAELPFSVNRPIRVESKGISADVQIISEIDSATGREIGKKIKITAIAKPVTTTKESSTDVAKRDEKRATTVAVSEEKTKPRSWLPWWVYPLAIVAITGVFYKELKQFFKS